jgi:hypothetical protein
MAVVADLPEPLARRTVPIFGHQFQTLKLCLGWPRMWHGSKPSLLPCFIGYLPHTPLALFRVVDS